VVGGWIGPEAGQIKSVRQPNGFWKTQTSYTKRMAKRMSQRNNKTLLLPPCEEIKWHDAELVNMVEPKLANAVSAQEDGDTNEANLLDVAWSRT